MAKKVYTAKVPSGRWTFEWELTFESSESRGGAQSTSESVDSILKGGAPLPPEKEEVRLTICTKLLERYEAEKDTFLDSIVTCDEIQLNYWNPDKEKGHYPDRMLFTIFWDSKGVIHMDSYPGPLTAQRYTDLLKDKVKNELWTLRKKEGKSVCFLHDNATSHTAEITKHVLEELEWDVLPHPPHSPDLAPSDYYLFPKLPTLYGKHEYKDKDEVSKAVKKFLEHKDEDFFRKGIQDLPKRWKKCIDKNGARFDEVKEK